MQTWLALPDGKEEIEPAFENVGPDRLPVVEGDGVAARILIGDLWGHSASTIYPAHTIYADIQLRAGASIPVNSEADERAILLTEGSASLDGQAIDLFSLYVLAPGTKPVLSATSASRAMLLGGEAFATPRHVWWNFVSSSRDRINQAKEDWQQRRFPLIPGDEEEFIPIPAVPKTVSYP
jgi:redox-sensitive bicupin YhaK (pirin superfamily)